MYEILESVFLTIKENMSIIRVFIQVDSEGDLPVPLDNWAVGSCAWIADEHSFRALNSERKWV